MSFFLDFLYFSYLIILFLPCLVWLSCWVLSCRLKGCWFNSWAGKVPGLQVWSSAGVCARGNWLIFLFHIDVSLPLFLPLFLSLWKYKIKKYLKSNNFIFYSKNSIKTQTFLCHRLLKLFHYFYFIIINSWLLISRIFLHLLLNLKILYKLFLICSLTNLKYSMNWWHQVGV